MARSPSPEPRSAEGMRRSPFSAFRSSRRMRRSPAIGIHEAEREQHSLSPTERSAGGIFHRRSFAELSSPSGLHSLPTLKHRTQGMRLDHLSKVLEGRGMRRDNGGRNRPPRGARLAARGTRHSLRPQSSGGWYARLAPIQVLSLLKSTPIIFPLLRRTRLLMSLGRSFQTNIMRTSALAGSSGVSIAAA